MENGSVSARYRIISSIGKGGMGEVYLAEETRLDHKVAVKFLNENKLLVFGILVNNSAVIFYGINLDQNTEAKWLD